MPEIQDWQYICESLMPGQILTLFHERLWERQREREENVRFIPALQALDFLQWNLPKASALPSSCDAFSWNEGLDTARITEYHCFMYKYKDNNPHLQSLRKQGQMFHMNVPGCQLK